MASSRTAALAARPGATRAQSGGAGPRAHAAAHTHELAWGLQRSPGGTLAVGGLKVSPLPVRFSGILAGAAATGRTARSLETHRAWADTPGPRRTLRARAPPFHRSLRATAKPISDAQVMTAVAVCSLQSRAARNTPSRSSPRPRTLSGAAGASRLNTEGPVLLVCGAPRQRRPSDSILAITRSACSSMVASSTWPAAGRCGGPE